MIRATVNVGVVPERVNPVDLQMNTQLQKSALIITAEQRLGDPPTSITLHQQLCKPSFPSAVFSSVHHALPGRSKSFALAFIEIKSFPFAESIQLARLDRAVVKSINEAHLRLASLVHVHGEPNRIILQDPAIPKMCCVAVNCLPGERGTIDESIFGQPCVPVSD